MKHEARQTRPTMVDVARHAGVSQTTVSFVLNDRIDVPIAAETRRRVLESATALGYRPNRAAQDLKRGTSSVLGIVSNGIASHPFAGRMILGIQKAARDAGYVCMLVDTLDDPEGRDDAVRNLLDRGVAGLIYASPATKPVRQVDAGPHVRTVFSGCWPENGDPGEAVILPDDAEGGRLAARELFDHGHRRVAFLGGTYREQATIDREQGLDRACDEAGIARKSIWRRYGDYSIESGYRLARQAMSEGEFTGLICGNDRMALGALLALHELHLEAPGQVSIVGYDDQEELAEEMRPAFTTVALPHFEMGLIAGQRLVTAAAEHPARVLVPCPLIVRDSVIDVAQVGPGN
jgi:LacI family transcriptional regulator